MNSIALRASLTAALLALTSLAYAHKDHGKEVTESKKESSAKVPANYPTDRCVVSGDKLGDMGKPIEFVHKQGGKPDRVVWLCCKDCVADFKKEPAKHLAKLDEAAAAKAKDAQHKN
jgi:hypothetical protein